MDYWYNAEGVKVRQVNTNGTTVTTLDYLGEFVFENNAISYILHEEGRAAYENSAFQYEFFIKDHLGNVRQVVRNPASNLRVATMEPENAEEEEKHFKNIKESRQGAAEHNKTPGGYATAWLNAERGRILGPSRSQEVQQGDSVEIGVFGKYVDPKKIKLSPATFARTGMDSKIIRTLGEYGQNLAASPNEIAIANVIALVISELQQKPVPEAYMGYALYDADSNRYEVGKIVLSKNARNKHEELIQKIAIKKDGYIETFLVNETSENVWFDQFRIMSTGPLIVQETHYDPWGVELSGLRYQYGGIKVNPYLYNGKELTSGLGVIMYDYGARLYIPAIGSWFVSDPLAELMRGNSPYNYAFNNPIRFIDPDGMAPYSVQGTPVVSGESASEECPNCSAEEESGSLYGDGAVVQNRFGASQYRDGKWVKIWSAPMAQNSSEGIKINGMFGGGSNGYGVQNGGGVGQPGTLESMIPVWGSGRSAVDDFQSGNYGRAAFHTAMAISDVFLVKSIATGIGKGAWKLGSHSWSATRKWMGKRGYAESGQPVHHWAVHQATAKKYGLEAVTNQPWNLMKFPNQSLHLRAGHGMNYLGQPGYGALGQFWYGTPTWFKAATISGGGRIVD